MQPLLGQTMMALVGQNGGGPSALDEVPLLSLAERATRAAVPTRTAWRGRNENTSVVRLKRVARKPSDTTRTNRRGFGRAGLGFAFLPRTIRRGISAFCIPDLRLSWPQEARLPFDPDFSGGAERAAVLWPPGDAVVPWDARRNPADMVLFSERQEA